MKFVMKGLILTTGAIIQGIAMGAFLFPHDIPSGGAAGLSVLMKHLFSIPYGVTLWFVNVGMLMAAIKWLGISNALWTMFCVTVTSFTINLITPMIAHPLSYALVDLSIGSIVFGIGVGILFRMGASSGGMDILALIISKWRNTPPGTSLFWINATILLSTGIVVDWKVIIYAIICQWIGTRVINFVMHYSIKGSRENSKSN